MHAPQNLVQAAEQHGHADVFASWKDLTSEQQQELLGSVEGIDFDDLSHAYKSSVACAEETKQAPEPLTDVITQQDITPEQRKQWTQKGFEMIAEGKYAVLVLAGGQGSRLGSSAPKGCYDIGLPSHKSLFQLQAERVGKVQELAATTVKGPGAAVTKPMRLYIMTSGSTDAATKAFFGEHSNFGLSKDQVVFFQQGELPCLTKEGKVIMATPHKVAKAPDGNGGVYLALERSGALADMEKYGVEALDCCSVDNVLAPLGDPLFAGACAAKNAECGARVVAKRSPSEKVGVFARRGDAVEVVEYSELGQAEAEATYDDGSLKYNWSNVCMHYFRVGFLQRMARQLVADGRYHIANKNIPSKDGPVKGIKLELFIFDTFPLAGDAVALVEVRRAEQFSPLKNGPGEAEDSPISARHDVLQLHKRWVEAAGGKVVAEEGVEVSPTVSYAGEGLAPLCEGRTFTDPLAEALQGRGLAKGS